MSFRSNVNTDSGPSASGEPPDTPYANYVTIQDLRDTLELNDSYVDSDGKIAEIVENASRHLSVELTPYTERAPIEEGSSVWVEASRTGLLYAQKLWFEHIFQAEKAKIFSDTFKDALKALKMALKVEPTSRQDPLTVLRTDFEGERRVPYSQIGFGGTQDHLL